MYAKYTAIAFALLATVFAQDEEKSVDGAMQTPEPDWNVDWWTLVTVPEDFGEFDNNIDYIGFALWDDGEDSAIFDWAKTDYVENEDYYEPTGEVFAAQVGFLEAITDTQSYYLCFDNEDFASAYCAVYE